MEKKCTVNFIFSIMLTLLSIVLLVKSFAYHDAMREELYGGTSNSDAVSADSGSDGSDIIDSDTNTNSITMTNIDTEAAGSASSSSDTEENVNVIPASMMNYLITYGVSFISAAFSMLYSYRVFKNSKRRFLVSASYCIFALDILSIAIGLLVRLGIL